MIATGATERARLGFRRHLHADVVPGEGVYLFSEHGVTAVQSAAVEALVPLLDGTRDANGVLHDLPAGMARDEARTAIAGLARAGLLGLRTELRPDPSLVYWDAIGVDDASAACVPTSPVQLMCVGDVDAQSAAEALTGAGLHLVGDGSARPHEAAVLSVVLCDDYLTPDLADVCRAHRAAGRPWLLAKPFGTRIWVGPVFQRGSACWHCLRTRLWGNRQAEAYVQRALGRPGCAKRPQPRLRPLTDMGLNLVALEASKWLAGHRYAGQGHVWTLDSCELTARHHELRRIPQCAACGDPDLLRQRAWQPVRLAADSDGPRRDSDAFVAAFRHLVSPVTGVVRDIQRAERGPAMLCTFRAGPSQALGARGLESLRAAQRIENGGKGVTAIDGEASALGEALERHCGTWHGDEASIRGRYEDLGERAIHPNACQLYDERQYQDRNRWNAEHSAFQYVCDRFDPTAELDWTPVWSLTHGRTRLLPTGMLYYGAPMDGDRVYVTADSNGNAAGADLTDAVLCGLVELLERDAVAIWWYNRTRHPAVDLDAFDDGWIGRLREVYCRMGRDLWVLDVTADLDAPVFVAVSRRTDRPREDILLGFGAHPDARTALTRALTELNQLTPLVADLGPDGNSGGTDPDALHWWRTATVDTEPYLLPAQWVPAKRPEDYPANCGGPSQQIERIRGRLEEGGMEVLVLDQTRPDIGVAVAKVLVPGLRHFWARYAPGRLFDVPVALGRRATPTAYEALNPIPMFL